ncbi:MAG: hypothetical protein H6828_12315 [Planctomycetes bacterium]|nr:hypothetical protein [Planctomycetota bacterium]
MKFEKLASHAAWLDHNLKVARPKSRGRSSFEPQRLHFDEFETYESRRNTRPLSIAVMIESRTRLLVAAVAAPIRPRGRKTPAREAAIARETELLGARRDRSRSACRWVFRRAARMGFSGVVVLRTDEKGTYSSYARRAFRGRRLVHLRTSSKIARDRRNPLFPINHTEAVLRDLMGRLRRRSWLVSKRRRFLNLHLALYAAWRNWVRPRFNSDDLCPGELAGLVPRRLSAGELVGWRQDWGGSSPSPSWTGRALPRAD